MYKLIVYDLELAENVEIIIWFGDDCINDYKSAKNTEFSGIW